MKIVMLLSNPFRPDPRVYKEALSLGRLGHRLTLVAWDRAAELAPDEALSPSVRIMRVQDVRSAYGVGAAQLRHLPRFWKACLSRLDQLDPDLVHCHDFDTLPAGLWWGLKHRRPVVYDAHEYYADLVRPRLKGLAGALLYQAVRLAEAAGARLASGVVTVDETLGARYRQLNRRVVIVGHYPSRGFIPEPAQVFTGPELRLLYAGRLSLDRGLLVYADLLRSLRAAGIPARLRLAGVFTPAEEELRFRQASRGLEAWTEVLGWVPYGRIPEVLCAADVGLALLQPEPRYVAALPVKLFEYMAAGLPVLASDFPPIRHVLQRADCGACVDPGRVSAALAVLQRWWDDPPRARQLGENARQAVLHEYNWESLIERLDRLYQQLNPAGLRDRQA
jgi:glycosyltransferase involved in cell wall biosynthesis